MTNLEIFLLIYISTVWIGWLLTFFLGINSELFQIIVIGMSFPIAIPFLIYHYIKNIKGEKNDNSGKI